MSATAPHKGLVEAGLDSAVYEQIEKLLEDEEGLRLVVYDDATGKEIKSGDTVVGTPTVGYGHNMNVPIPHHIAELLLRYDIGRTVGLLSDGIPWWHTLDIQARLVLLSMCYELGLHGLLGFHDFLHALKHGDRKEARRQMLNSRWAKEVPHRAHELADLLCPPASAS